jgi:hypothetical protein
VLKGALPKDDVPVPSTSRAADVPVPLDISLAHPHLHTFDDPPSADSEHWSLPFHSSSVRHDPPLEDRRSSYSMRSDDSAGKYDAGGATEAFEK